MRRITWKLGVFTGIAVLLAVLVLTPPLTAWAGEEEESEDKGRTYTNEDLGEDGSGAEAAGKAEAPAAGDPDDPLRPFRNAENARLWRQNRLREARREIAEMERQIEYWKARRLSIQNPYYPRPAAPEAVDEEGQDAGEGLDGPALVAQVDERLEALQKRLAEARQKLAAMEREFREADRRPPETPAGPAPPPSPHS